MTRTPQMTVNLYYTKQPLLPQNPPPVIQPKTSKKTRRKYKSKNRIKCVIVGDKEVGKTALATTYCNASFPSEYVPTAYDHYNVEVQVDGKPIRLELCDTAGKDELNPLRNLCYPGADVFILCFSVVKMSSFNSALTRWAEELTRLGVPVVLVGTQSDLRGVTGRSRLTVSEEEAKGLAENLNAPYVETSAKNSYELKKAFDLAITLALEHKRRSWWRRLPCFY